MVTARCSLSTEIMTGQRLEQACTAELIDGSVILLRQLELSDAEDILALYESLTDEERYFRFFAMHPAHLEDWARSIAEPRGDQYSLGAYSAGKLLGVANYVALSRTRIRRGGGRGGTRRTPSRCRYRAAAPARRHREDKRTASSRCRGAVGEPPHASGAFGDRLALHPTPRGFGATRRDRPWRGACH